MGGLLKAAKSVRIVWAVIGLIGVASAFFGIGIITAFVQINMGPIPEDVAFIGESAIEIFLFGVAAGAGIISYLLLGYVQDEKQ